MEDNSYVSLSLEKYNELYDKAKKYDELTMMVSEEITKNIGDIFEGLKNTIESIFDDTDENEDKEKEGK